MFIIPEDIVNRGLQHIGVPRISALTDQSKQATEANFAYDKLRLSELQKAVWGFATRRAVLRKIDIAGGTSRFITPAVYSSATAYGQGDVVSYNNVYWISNKASNTGNTPSSAGVNPAWSVYYGVLVAQAWSASVAYIPGDLVWVTSTAYICIAATTNNTPPNTTFWLPLTATLSTISFFSPVGYSINGSAQRQVYRLPANFLRIAPLDAKATGVVRQNVTAGMGFNDYEIESGYLFSAVQGSSGTPDPLVLRFVADQNDVPTMDPLFCEALAARIGIALAEPMTQSKDKLAEVTALYDNVVSTARFFNAIEAGTTEPDAAQPTAPTQAGGGQGGR